MAGTRQTGGIDPLIHAPRQLRSAQTLTRLLSATRELLATREFDQISVDEIVELAGSSKGSFYARFPNKRALLSHILQEEYEAAVTAWSTLLEPARWADSPLSDVLDAFLDRLMEIYRTRKPKMRAFVGQVFAGDEEIRRLSIQLNRHVLHELKRIVLEKRDQVEHTNPEQATEFLVAALTLLLPPLFLAADQERFSLSMNEDALESEVRHLTRRYLGV